MRDLTIKMKLILSFSIIILLVSILSIKSTSGISQTSNGFNSYREIARDTVLASQIQSNMLMIRMNVKDYLVSNSQEDIEQFNSYFSKTEEFIETALEKSETLEKVKDLKPFKNNLFGFKNFRFHNVGDLVQKKSPLQSAEG